MDDVDDPEGPTLYEWAGGHVAHWWAEVLGGPETYTEHHGGYEAMLSHHLGLAITASQRHRFASTMSLAADAPITRLDNLAGHHN